jgi:two-component system, cell cycle response regulator
VNRLNPSVLIVDDDPELALMLEASVRHAGWNAVTCLESRDAARIARTTNPKVILCDARMPGMSGPEVIAGLKSEPSTAHIPIVLMTGWAEANQFTDVAWTAFLEKPFTSAELAEVIKRAAETVIPSRIQADDMPRSG